MPAAPALRKTLGVRHLWALAVGLVISGEYFGWNYGWAAGGPGAMLVATGLVTVLYVAFVFSFTELTTALPQAGGPFAYALRAFGPVGGVVAGYATVVEFGLAAPAIALALGSYGHFLWPALPVLPLALGAYAVFTGVNLLGIRESATFSLVVTGLAVAELLLFMGLLAPHFQVATLLAHPVPVRPAGVLAALPYAIWLYLAIEGVAMVAEEVREPRRAIPLGYGLGIGTLVMLALGVLLLTQGAADWRQLTHLDYPLPEALRLALGPSSPWARALASLGLLGLVASLHGAITGYSRQVFALARAGYLPARLAQLNKRGAPAGALAAGALAGVAALGTGTTNQVIMLSVLGALVLYSISMASLFQLRWREPALARPFRAPGYPLVPALALGLALGCLGAVVWLNPGLSVLFGAGLVLYWGVNRWGSRPGAGFPPGPPPS